MNSFELVTYFWSVRNFQRERGEGDSEGCPRMGNRIINSESESSVYDIIKVIVTRCVLVTKVNLVLLSNEGRAQEMTQGIVTTRGRGCI